MARRTRGGRTSAPSTRRPARSPARPRGCCDRKEAERSVFVGTASAANARERRDGFFVGAGPEFQKDKGEVFEDGTEPSRAQGNIQTAISKYPDVGVFLGLWSYNAHFIAEEVAKFPELRKRKPRSSPSTSMSLPLTTWPRVRST